MHFSPIKFQKVVILAHYFKKLQFWPLLSQSCWEEDTCPKKGAIIATFWEYKGSKDLISLMLGVERADFPKHKGSLLSFFFIGGQNRNFLKLKGIKVHFSLKVNSRQSSPCLARVPKLVIYNINNSILLYSIVHVALLWPNNH